MFKANHQLPTLTSSLIFLLDSLAFRVAILSAASWNKIFGFQVLKSRVKYFTIYSFSFPSSFQNTKLHWSHFFGFFSRTFGQIFAKFYQNFYFHSITRPPFCTYPSLIFTSSQYVTSAESTHSDPVYWSFLHPTPPTEPIFSLNLFAQVMRCYFHSIFKSDRLIFTDFYTKWTIIFTCAAKLFTWFSFFHS